jgi:hypothetical protein
MSLLNRVANFEVHHRQFIALGAAGIYCIAMWGQSLWITHIIATWDVYALMVLLISWIAITKSNPSQDASQSMIFSIVISAGIFSN